MHLSFIRIDGSSLPKGADAAPSFLQVVAVESRPGRMPIDRAHLAEGGGVTALAWVGADGLREAINVTNDATLQGAFLGGGLVFSEFTEDGGIHKEVAQVILESPVDTMPQQRGV